HMSARAKWFECVDQFVIIHFIDRRVNCAAAAVRVAQELQYLVTGIAGKILSRLEAGRLEVFEELIKRFPGYSAFTKPANDRRQQRATTEVSLQSASNVTRGDFRIRPVRHRVFVWSEGSAADFRHRGHAVRDNVGFDNCMVRPDAPPDW